MSARKQPVIEGFSYYQTIERLRTANLVIHTIPGEEWMLSCERHKNLLVDIYTLTGKERRARKPISYQCGRLGENLLRLMRYNRKVQFISHNSHTEEEGNITAYTKAHVLADTFEEDFLIRLRSGDIVFCLIPGKRWRLTSTYFRGEASAGMLYFADEETIGCPDLHMFRGTKMEHVLLEFLCQNAKFVDKQAQPKVLEFKR